jgi:hypothetical protein
MRSLGVYFNTVAGQSSFPCSPGVAAFQLSQVAGPAGLGHRLKLSWNMAAGQLAVFQGASEAPISEPYESSEQREKQPTSRGPEMALKMGEIQRAGRFGAFKAKPASRR